MNMDRLHPKGNTDACKKAREGAVFAMEVRVAFVFPSPTLFSYYVRPCRPCYPSLILQGSYDRGDTKRNMRCVGTSNWPYLANAYEHIQLEEGEEERGGPPPLLDSWEEEEGEEERARFIGGWDTSIYRRYSPFPAGKTFYSTLT